LRRLEDEDIEEGRGEEVETTQQGKAREAITQEGQIVIEEGHGDRWGNDGEVSKTVGGEEDSMDVDFKGGELGEKGRPFAGRQGEEAEVDRGEVGPGETLDLADKRELGEDKEDGVATAIPLSQGGRAPP